MGYPASERVLMFFVAHLFTEHLSHGSIKSYLAAVRHAQICRGLGDPGIAAMPQLEYVMKGIKRSSPQSMRSRLPITPGILRDLRQVWRKMDNKWDAKMLWAASCLCFFGFLRSGEVVTPTETDFDGQCHLCYEDVRVDNRISPSYIQVTLKASKTDPFRQGVEVYVGVTKNELCPVTAVLSFMVLRGNSPGPLFRRSNGRFLTRQVFVSSLRAALVEAGYPAEKYAGHSFRIGAATTASRCGLQDALIKTLGRWESQAYQTYVQTPPERLCEVARVLSGPVPSDK